MERPNFKVGYEKLESTLKHPSPTRMLASVLSKELAIVCKLLVAMLLPSLLTAEDGTFPDPVCDGADDAFGNDPPDDNVDAKCYPSKISLDVPAGQYEVDDHQTGAGQGVQRVGCQQFSEDRTHGHAPHS